MNNKERMKLTIAQTVICRRNDHTHHIQCIKRMARICEYGFREKLEGLTGGSGKFQGTEADIIKSLIVEHHTLVSVLHELMNRQGGIVWLDNSI